jgi:hypothetical protein
MFESFFGGSTDQGKLVPDDDYDLYRETIETSPSGIDLVKKILADEQLRLDEKDKIVSPIYETKLRQKEQMKSITMRNTAYNNLFMVFAGTLAIVLLLNILRDRIPTLPEFIMDILTILVVSIGIILMLVMYIDIVKRDIMDYEKIDYGLLTDPKKNEDNTKTGISDNTVSNINKCIGGVCCKTGDFFIDNKCSRCPEGLRYSDSESKCVETFENYDGKKNVKPYYRLPNYSSIW